MMSDTLLIEPHYLPTTACFKRIYKAKTIYLEVCGQYHKKTFENRCYLASPQGLQRLTIPIQHATRHGHYRDVKIDYDMPWPAYHTKTFQVAYGKTPYYAYFEDLLAPILLRKPTFLLDVTLPLIHACCRFLRLKKKIVLTSAYRTTTDGMLDLRYHITPQKQDDKAISPPYSPNLSVLHLLANKGSYAHAFLATPSKL